MKKLSIIAAICVVFASCNKINENESEYKQSQTLVPVAVRVNDFSITKEDMGNPVMTRATATVDEYQGIKAITLVFYKGATEAYKCTQLRSESETYTTFGEFSTSLSMGDYTMVVIANGGSNVPTLTSATSATYGENSVGDTFVATQDVSIHNTSAVNINTTLNRINTMLALISNDGRTAEATKVRITTSTGGKSFNPTTGFATVNSGFTATLTPSASVGNTISTGIFMFLADDEQNTDVTIETLDDDNNVIFSKTIQNVSMQRNYMTQLKGDMYTNSSITSSFQVEKDWQNTNTVNF